MLIRLIDRLFQQPSITIIEAAEVLGVSQQAAANNIHTLEEHGILEEVTGRDRNKVFVAKELMKFMYDTTDEAETAATA